MTQATRDTTTDGNTAIIREKSGSGGIIIGVLVVIGLAGAAFFYARGQNSEMARDAAITDAAQQVGDSVESAGSAVEDAARSAGGE
ncbi:MAG: hypothetical protein ACXIT4_07520 [Erythrobacter sp.]